MDKVLNVETKRKIKKEGATFNRLIKKGYVYDPDTNTIAPPGTAITINTSTTTVNTSPNTRNTIITKTHKPIKQIKYNKPKFTDIDDADIIMHNIDLGCAQIDQIIHLSDIHIPMNLHTKRSDEYNTVFNRLYNKIRQSTNSIIVITGDLMHTKLKMEPETILMARQFLHSLSTIAPTIVTIGNHDFAQNNTERLDSLTAICDGLDVHLLKHTGIYKTSNIVFVFNSLFDCKFITRDMVKTSLPVYALYHGTVVGSINDNGTSNKESKTKSYPALYDFDGFNAVLLGHIHKRQFLKPHIAYAGSLIQQNFGESIDNHGFLIWNTNTHLPTSVNIPNDYVRINVSANEGIITNTHLLDKYNDRKLMVKIAISNTNTAQLQTLTNNITSKYNIFQFNFTKPTKHSTNITNSITSHNDISIDDEIQFIKDKTNKPLLIDDIVTMHHKLHQNLSYTTSIWYPVNITFKNLGIFGNDYNNFIDFSTGISNICAPNGTGKSTIVNIILYTLFGRTSSARIGSMDIINKYSKSADMNFTFIHNNNTYTIDRVIASQVRNDRINYDTITTQKLLFNRIEPNGQRTLLNGASTTYTQQIINSYIGSFDQFINNNIISSRSDISSMLSKKPTELFKHIHTICNTSHYADYVDQSKKISKPAKKQLMDLIAINKHISQQINTIDINSSKSDIIDNQNKLLDANNKLDTLNQQRNTLEVQISTINQSINNVDDFDPNTDYSSKLDQFNQQLLNEANSHTLSSINTLINDIPTLDQSIDHHQLILDYSSKRDTHLKPTLHHTQLIQLISTTEAELSQLSLTLKSTTTSIGQIKPHSSDSLQSLKQSITGLNVAKYSYDDIPAINNTIDQLQLNINDDTLNPDMLHSLQSDLQTFNKPTNPDPIRDKLISTQAKYTQLTGNDVVIYADGLDEAHPIQINGYSIDDIPDIQHTIDSIIIDDINVSDNLQVEDLQLKEQQLLTSLSNFNNIPITETNLNLQYLHSLLIPTDNNTYTLTHDTVDLQLQMLDISSKYNDSWFLKYVDTEHSTYNIPIDTFNQQYSNINHIKLEQLKHLYSTNIQYHRNNLNQLLTQKHNNHIHSQINFINKANLTKQLDSIQYKIKQYTLRSQKQSLTNILDKLTTNKQAVIHYTAQLFNLYSRQLDDIELNQLNKQQIIQNIHDINHIIQIQSLSNIIDNLCTINNVHAKMAFIYQQLINNKQSLLKQYNSALEWFRLDQLITHSQTTINNINKLNHLHTLKQIIIIRNLIKYKQLNTLQNNLNLLKPDIDLLHANILSISTSINNINSDIKQFNTLSTTLSDNTSTINDLQHTVDIHSEYQRLFDRKNIPALILLSRLKSFINNANQIFSLHTKYSLQFTLTDKTLALYVTDKTTNANLHTSRLCGFETVILDIALNRAALDISLANKPSLFIIDERLDCIDQIQFSSVVSKLTTILKDNFHVNIIISHRDIPDDIIDSKIKISHRSNSSYIE